MNNYSADRKVMGNPTRLFPALIAVLLAPACAPRSMERGPASQYSKPAVHSLQCQALSMPDTAATAASDLVFPGLLARESMLQGNPLVTYGAMLDLEPLYLASPVFRQVYPEIRLNMEQFLGMPCAGQQAMKIMGVQGVSDTSRIRAFDEFRPAPALEVIRTRAAATQIVIWAEEHHMPQTRSLYEPLLRLLREQGYSYLAAEAFEDADMGTFTQPGYQSGYYLRDPVFASAVRLAQALGYVLVSYDTRERSETPSFRDVTQARNIVQRIFSVDPAARVLILAGRGHAAETSSSDWTPMGYMLKQLTGIDPLTLYAPTMTERLAREDEDPLYRHATSQGLVTEPVIFEYRGNGQMLGSKSFDAYVFFPRTRLIGGRPDWLVTTLQRVPVTIPETLLVGGGLRLIQAFHEGSHVTSIPQDQILVTGNAFDPTHLMLPPGRFRLRSIDMEGTTIHVTNIIVAAPAGQTR